MSVAFGKERSPAEGRNRAFARPRSPLAEVRTFSSLANTVGAPYAHGRFATTS
jgi:hypothetical protein